VTPDEITRVLAAKRQIHPELARALSWPAFQRICEREGVRLRRSPEPMPRPAQLIPYLGRWTILFNCDAPHRRLTYYGAHELGHLWLHHDSRFERWERVYNMDTYWANDPREDDAELFASLVLMGPTRAKPYSGDPRAESALQFALRTVRRIPRGPR
jgi:Zn-dependent peptidase ImmA (M78 family)